MQPAHFVNTISAKQRMANGAWHPERGISEPCPHSGIRFDLQQPVTQRSRMFPARCRGGPCGRPWCDLAGAVRSETPHPQGRPMPGRRCGIPSDSKHGQAQGLPLHRVCSSPSPKGHGCFLRDVGAALVAARGVGGTAFRSRTWSWWPGTDRGRRGARGPQPVFTGARSPVRSPAGFCG